MEIGNIIYTRRKELGLTLEQIGDYVGVSKSTVKKWESGYISNMRRDKISLLAKILKIPPTDLINEESETVAPALLPNANEQELIKIYRNVNQDGQDYIMQTARMVEGTERYRKYETVRAASRSVTDKPIEDIKVEKSKIRAALSDDSIKDDNDL